MQIHEFLGFLIAILVCIILIIMSFICTQLLNSVRKIKKSKV